MSLQSAFSCFVLFLLLDGIDCKATISDCGGPDKSLSFKQGSLYPDPISYPGDILVNADVDVLKKLPTTGLIMSLQLTKLEPTEMPVPCLKNIGSCQYDVCNMISKYPKQFCPMFPAGEECGCPMNIGHYTVQNSTVTLPDFGPIFAKILQGSYSGNITFIDSSKKTELACMKMTFEIEPKK